MRSRFGQGLASDSWARRSARTGTEVLMRTQRLPRERSTPVNAMTGRELRKEKKMITNHRSSARDRQENQNLLYRTHTRCERGLHGDPCKWPAS